MRLSRTTQVVLDMFITNAITAAKPAEQASLQAHATTLRAVLEAETATQAREPSPTHQTYSVTVQYVGTAHFQGMEALASALGITKNSCSVRLSHAKGYWGTTRYSADGNPVEVLVRRGLWDEHSAEAAAFLVDAPRRTSGRPARGEMLLRKPAKRKATPPGSNRLKNIRTPYDEEEHTAPTADEMPDDFTGKWKGQYFISGQRTTQTMLDDHLKAG